MPWHIEENHTDCPNGFAVIKDDDGAVAGCHETHEAATAQLGALYASEDRAAPDLEVQLSDGGFEIEAESPPAKRAPKTETPSIAVYSARFPATLRLNALESDAREGVLEKLKGLGISESEVFVFGAEISSNRQDSYFTRMHRTSLKNFATDLTNGISFLDSHDNWRLGYGYSLIGTFEEGEVERTTGIFYTVKGVHFGASRSFATSDDFIKAVQSRIVRDVSTGFYADDTICDICKQPVWGRTECEHIPGMPYEVDGKSSRAAATIKNARLAEVSAVYDGATPYAMIEKAEWLAERGVLETRVIDQLAHQYRIHIPKRNPIIQGGIMTKPETTNKPPAEETPQPAANDTPGATPVVNQEETMTEETRAQLIEAGAPKSKDDEGKITWSIERIRTLQKEVETLRPLAQDGETYRGHLIDAALSYGVRAFETFDKGKRKAILEKQGLDEIREMGQMWKEIGDAKFPGGRQSVDETEGNAPLFDDLPDSAFQTI